ncbi:Hypothetical protein I595_3300 [Croceitalea dokdonensis DOKDO 023]|uniref:Uncharacterized protein n=1 Tax=Croceitalea dokdonensis DOKDO 023 TaxID=1300341 RepID=A0A0P7ASG9_9FLAO|nr:Hypothetical protein I595_3300 [Croceitalea dokdonensis DOKDO 023]
MLAVVSTPCPLPNGRATDLSPVVFAAFSTRRQAIADGPRINALKPAKIGSDGPKVDLRTDCAPIPYRRQKGRPRKLPYRPGPNQANLTGLTNKYRGFFAFLINVPLAHRLSN